MKLLLKTIALLLALLILVVGGYVLYLQLSFYRIPDNANIPVDTLAEKPLEVGQEYSALSYNIGFGAYSQEYSFFMDKGKMKDGTAVQGKYGKGISRESVFKNTVGSIDLSKSLNADILMLQEVDVKAHRSYGLNQRDLFINAYKDYSSSFAHNFHSAYLFYPFSDPHGAVEAGLLTLSKYKVNSAVRVSLPIDMSFITKFTDLDRCLSVNRLAVANGKELVLINTHLSAYDEGGLIRKQQFSILNNLIEEEYNKGNYVIVGGDYNHVLCDTAGVFPSEQLVPDWIFKINDSDLFKSSHVVEAKNVREVPTCRSADIPYEKGKNYSVVLDGFIVTDNVDATAENIDNDFMFSDHNPVKLSFKLKP